MSVELYSVFHFEISLCVGRLWRWLAGVHSAAWSWHSTSECSILKGIRVVSTVWLLIMKQLGTSVLRALSKRDLDLPWGTALV